MACLRCVSVCVYVDAVNEGIGKDGERERNRRADLCDEKVVQIASNFQANQRGTSWTLTDWSEGCERLLKGWKGHKSSAQITRLSYLTVTYPGQGRTRVRLSLWVACIWLVWGKTVLTKNMPKQKLASWEENKLGNRFVNTVEERQECNRRAICCWGNVKVSTWTQRMQPH